MLYKFCRKPTVAILYKGETLKRLLDQRWTGHFGAVSIILRSFDDLSTLLREINSSPAYGADVRVEAAGLLRAMSEPSFRFIAKMVHKILSYLGPPNLMLQAEDMDLLTVEERIIYEDLSDETELRRMYFSYIDAVCGEMKERFGERNCVLMDALRSLDPEDSTFLDVSKVKPLLDLTNTPIVESEYTVAHQFLSMQMKDSFPADGGKRTMKKVLQHFQKPLEAMPSVMMVLKHALTFGASTALCENYFSTLKNVLTEHRLSMLHRRKANLIKLTFEKDLTKKFREEWKDIVLRRFHSVAQRCLPLY
ncbi:hypothetical protein G5714_023610 [Onychostoma macrolepis]|uniref:HAT C-terminal dimerisation domain-containing protein n=1 Tax=Onychostoma macrolepis TaxID=369639 RepID=A0A7J6BLQ0_9TELE|nr:hypothetical protein G5714_023610 [Onychostoma macrolepis]